MHRLFHWTRGHVEVLRAWQRHSARHFVDWPRLTAIYTQLKALPSTQQTHWRRRCKATLWGVALCLAASGVQPVYADTITVDGTACTLVNAITTANSDSDTGGCVQTGTVSLADTIILTVDTTLMAGYSAVSSEITIEGNGYTISRDSGAPAFRLLRVSSTGDLTLKNTTLSGGVANGSSGGGILNDSGQLRLEGCAVSGNSATYYGGGISNFFGKLRLEESTVSDNSATNGGGVFSRTNDTSAMSIVNSTISGNSAAHSGGGVYNRTFSASAMSIANSTVSGNSANSRGGGVFSFIITADTMSIVNSTISSNSTGGIGGGIYSRTDDGTVSLINSTISGNSADGHGGGAFSYTRSTGTTSLINSTVSGNSAGRGGGVSSYTDSYGAGATSISNSTISDNSADSHGGGVSSSNRHLGTNRLHRNLIAGNTAGGAGDEVYVPTGSFTITDYNLFGHSSITTVDALSNVSLGAMDILATFGETNATALNAILAALANNGGPTLTHALVTGSPAIDAAGDCGLATDQRGIARPQGVACDIGAFEVEARPPEVCGNCLDDDGDNKIDVADEDCAAVPLSSEKGAFSFKVASDKDQLSLNATFLLGPVIDPANEGVTVQFFDAAGQLACVQIPAGTVVRKSPGWKVKTGGTGTTWSFTDAKGGLLGDPTTDKLSVQCNTKKDVCMVKLNVKEANIAGDATARNITTGVIIGNDGWKKEQAWQPKAKGKKLVTP